MDASNFATFDFDDVWVMGTSGPELRNNPVYSYETSLSSCQVVAASWVSGSSFNVVLNQSSTTNYGADLYFNGILFHTINNVLTETVTIPPIDCEIVIVPFFIDGGEKKSQTSFNYFHYVLPAAVLPPTYIEKSNITPLTVLREGMENLDANAVHGSLLYNGYVYGVTRNDFPCYNKENEWGFNKNPVVLVRAPENDISSFELIPISASDAPESEYPRGEFSRGSAQIVECGGYLYFPFGCDHPIAGGVYTCQYNPTLNTYKVFRLGINGTGYPIGADVGDLSTDGTYLYLNSISKVYKLDPNQLVGDFPKYNVDELFIVDATVYDCDSQGGAILGGYDPRLKGIIHSSCCDAEYLYLSFTTQNGTDISGYYVPLDISTHEAHKVRKSDMTPAGWCKIPQSTDDMAQNATHLFYGIEVQPTADPRTFGYGWGAYAVRKSDMRLTALPRLHSLDVPPLTTSYGSIIFGDYLLDIKTNRTIYVIDITDVDNWSINEPIGNRTVAAYSYDGLIINELLLSSDNTFYGFGWSSVEDLAIIPIPGHFFSIPILNNPYTLVNENMVLLVGFILNNGGKPIINKGFRYGVTSDNLSMTITNEETTSEFSSVIIGLSSGTYYYQSFAVNSEGESMSSTYSFNISGSNSSSLPFYIGSSPIIKIYLGSTQILN
jgi:hypothetical protein